MAVSRPPEITGRLFAVLFFKLTIFVYDESLAGFFNEHSQYFQNAVA